MHMYYTPDPAPEPLRTIPIVYISRRLIDYNAASRGNVYGTLCIMDLSLSHHSSQAIARNDMVFHPLCARPFSRLSPSKCI